VLRAPAGRAAIGLPGDERFVGLLYLGRALQSAEPPARVALERYAQFLD
jgi:hypothetical protein